MFLCCELYQPFCVECFLTISANDVIYIYYHRSGKGVVENNALLATFKTLNPVEKELEIEKNRHSKCGRSHFYRVKPVHTVLEFLYQVKFPRDYFQVYVFGHSGNNM